MFDWKRPVEHKKIIKINLLIKTSDSKEKTMNAVQAELREAKTALKNMLVEMDLSYRYLTFELEEPKKLGSLTRKGKFSEGF